MSSAEQREADVASGAWSEEPNEVLSSRPAIAHKVPEMLPLPPGAPHTHPPPYHDSHHHHHHRHQSGHFPHPHGSYADMYSCLFGQAGMGYSGACGWGYQDMSSVPPPANQPPAAMEPDQIVTGMPLADFAQQMQMQQSQQQTAMMWWWQMWMSTMYNHGPALPWHQVSAGRA